MVFSYNADFGRDKVSTETVNGVTQQFTVPAHTAVTHTWPVFGTLTVGATWSGGKIPTVTLMCPPPAPPVTPPGHAARDASAAGHASAAAGHASAAAGHAAGAARGASGHAVRRLPPRR